MKNKNHENFYEVLKIDKENDILIIDPFALNLRNAKDTGIKNIICVRRPFWGRGNLSKFINKVEPVEFKRLLEKLTDEEE